MARHGPPESKTARCTPLTRLTANRRFTEALILRQDEGLQMRIERRVANGAATSWKILFFLLRQRFSTHRVNHGDQLTLFSSSTQRKQGLQFIKAFRPSRAASAKRAGVSPEHEASPATLEPLFPPVDTILSSRQIKTGLYARGWIHGVAGQGLPSRRTIAPAITGFGLKARRLHQRRTTR